MDDDPPPPQSTRPDGYNRVSTLEMGDPTPAPGGGGYNRVSMLEMEDPPPVTGPNTAVAGERDFVAEFRQFCYDLNLQMDNACQVIDWDRIFMTAFVTLSVILVLFAFFPYLHTQLISDQQFQHRFSLKTLTISEFRAEADQVSGKCEAMFNISNRGDRSIYHETSILSVFLDHELLWVTRTQDFFLDIGNSILFNVSINKSTVSVPASFVPTAMRESRVLHKTLFFKLKYDGMLREGLAAWYEERAHIYVICGWIEMNFLNATTLQGGPANCTIQN